jgi:hypothetical protein
MICPSVGSLVKIEGSATCFKKAFQVKVSLITAIDWLDEVLFVIELGMFWCRDRFLNQRSLK